MSGVKFHPELASELAEAIGWFVERSPQAATRLRAEFDQAVIRIVESPGLGHPCGPFRRVNLKRYPYHVLYDSGAAGEIWILAFRHDARHPEHSMERRIPEEP
ncbi:MAG: type II toxin-antitoxin system RelE/ParE family toxin [Haloferula sp.]